jgi:hypothetical protein
MREGRLNWLAGTPSHSPIVHFRFGALIAKPAPQFARGRLGNAAGQAAAADVEQDASKDIAHAIEYGWCQDRYKNTSVFPSSAALAQAAAQQNRSKLRLRSRNPQKDLNRF